MQALVGSKSGRTRPQIVERFRVLRAKWAVVKKKREAVAAAEAAITSRERELAKASDGGGGSGS